MNARFVKAVIIVTIFGGLLVFTRRPAFAGSWNFKPSFDGGPHIWEYHDSDSDYSHLSETNPPAPHPRDVPYSITLFNPTSWTIGYSINGNREPRLKPGETASWTIMGSKENPAVFDLAFDNGQKEQIQYRLENNRTYIFRDQDGGVGLIQESLALRHSINVSASRIEHLASDYARFMETQQQLPDARQVWDQAGQLRSAAARMRKARSEAEAFEHLKHVARDWNLLHSHLQRLNATEGTHSRRLKPINDLVNQMREQLEGK